MTGRNRSGCILPRVGSSSCIQQPHRIAMNEKPSDHQDSVLQSLPRPVIEQGRLEHLGKNQYLFHCGEPIDRLYLVLEGELRAIRHQADGQKAIMMRAGPGEFFAAASLCLDSFPCDGLAPVDTRLWSIPKSQFNHLLATSAELGQRFSLALAREIKKQCGRVERLRLQTARERILHYISCETEDGKTLQLATSLSTWADELGVEPESLYRSLSAMARDGLIERQRRCIRIRDRKENDS